MLINVPDYTIYHRTGLYIGWGLFLICIQEISPQDNSLEFPLEYPEKDRCLTGIITSQRQYMKPIFKIINANNQF